MLKIDHVTKRFGSFTAVNDLTLEIPDKQMFGLLGANGAGKTTTFRMILGLLNATEGTVTWKGQPINYGVTNSIGYLPEERGLYPKLKVKDQLVYLGRLKGMTKQNALKEMEKWLERFHITEYADKKVEEPVQREPAKNPVYHGRAAQAGAFDSRRAVQRARSGECRAFKRRGHFFERRRHLDCIFKPQNGACRRACANTSAFCSAGRLSFKGN